VTGQEWAPAKWSASLAGALKKPQPGSGHEQGAHWHARWWSAASKYTTELLHPNFSYAQGCLASRTKASTSTHGE